MKNKKGQASSGIWALVGIGVAFVVVGIVLAFGLNIIGDIKDDMVIAEDDTLACGLNSTGGTSGTTGRCSLAYNATIDSQEGVAKITEKLPLIGTVVVAVLIIGLLIVGFMGVRR